MNFFLPLLALTGAAFAADCHTEKPFAEECVTYYGGGGCNNPVGSYRPTCEGNCFVADFDSIHPRGGGFKTTQCYAYSDTECQNEILNTGAQGSGTCKQAIGAKSMKCYYDC